MTLFWSWIIHTVCTHLHNDVPTKQHVSATGSYSAYLECFYSTHYINTNLLGPGGARRNHNKRQTKHVTTTGPARGGSDVQLWTANLGVCPVTFPEALPLHRSKALITESISVATPVIRKEALSLFTAGECERAGEGLKISRQSVRILPEERLHCNAAQWPQNTAQ